MAKPLKVLVLDNTREPNSFGSKSIVNWSLKMTPEGTEVLVRRPPDFDLPSSDVAIDALVLSGSVTSGLEVKESWVGPFDDFLQKHIQLGTPILGICYGMQSLARCLFASAKTQNQIRRAENAELGWQTIQVTHASPLFKGLGKTFFTYESHYEEVFQVPPGTEVIAKSERSEIQGFQINGKAIFGIQFHPEYSVEAAEQALANKLKKGERKDWILNPGKGAKLYDENVGKTIFGNFFKIASERNS